MTAVMINGKMAGEIVGDVYVSHRIVSKHFYVKGRGYPISNSILKFLRQENVPKIRIIEHGVNKVTLYECSLEKYLNAVLIQEGGFDQQRVVPLIEMERIIILDSKGD